MPDRWMAILHLCLRFENCERRNVCHILRSSQGFEFFSAHLSWITEPESLHSVRKKVKVKIRITPIMDSYQIRHGRNNGSRMLYRTKRPKPGRKAVCRCSDHRLARPLSKQIFGFKIATRINQLIETKLCLGLQANQEILKGMTDHVAVAIKKFTMR